MSDRMSLKEYRAYLKSQGFSPVQVTGLSQGGQQVPSVPKPRKKHKYGAKPVRDKSGKQLYASKREAKRGAELELMQKQGLITGLKKQPKYKFVANDRMPFGWYFVDSGRVVQYWPDFEYYDIAGELIVEDVKGYKTPEYKLKAPMMWNYFEIEVQEI